MHRGLYSACSAMLVQETNLDVVTNNLANVNTVGFRRRIPVQSEFSALMDRIEKVSEDGETKILTVPPFTMNWKGRQTIGSLALATLFSETYMDSSPGVIQVTDNPFDVAIDGAGFFALQDNEGNTRYSRQGNFQVSSEGTLVTPDGMTLLGDGGPLSVEGATHAFINESGQLIADGALVGNVPLYTFENPTFLQQVGGNNFVANEASGAPVEVDQVRLLRGSLEVSNVSVVEEMVRMIEAQRAYEGASKALMSHDEQTGKLISSFSKV